MNKINQAGEMIQTEDSGLCMQKMFQAGDI